MVVSSPVSPDCASRLIVTRSTSSIVTGNLFLAGLWRALRLPGRIEYKGMRQDHATRPGEQREVEIGIEASRRSISLDFFKKIRTVGVVLLTHPDQQVKDGQVPPHRALVHPMEADAARSVAYSRDRGLVGSAAAGQ